MQLVSFLFTIPVLLFFSLRLQAAELTEANITAKIATNQGERYHAVPSITRKADFFKLLDLIKNGSSPATEDGKRDLITKLRDCLNHQYLPENLEQADEKAVDQIKNRLMKEEINFFRVSGIAGLNFMPTNYTELDLATLTGGLSTMVGKLVIGDEHGTGTLIAIPHGHGHKWAVLTCGHIIDSVGCDKDEDDEDRLIFELKQPGGTIVPLPIKQIKVFKRANQSFSITDIGYPSANPENSVILPDHIRALPRYDSKSDLALYFFDETQMIRTQTVPAYLDTQFPVVVQPNFHLGAVHGLNFLSFSINHSGQHINYTFPFVADDQNPLITDINAKAKTKMFALGYAAFETEELPTLSGARDIHRNHIYDGRTIASLI